MIDTIGKKYIDRAYFQIRNGAEKHFSETNKALDKLFKADHNLIGRVLKCHLIVEKYLNDCFLHFYGVDSNFQDANLTFYQKLTLLENKVPSFKIFFDGIKQLNKIRNKLSHDLKFKVRLDDVRSMKPLADWISNKNLTEPIEIIEKYTAVICMLLADDISEFGRKKRKILEAIINEERKLKEKVCQSVWYIS